MKRKISICSTKSSNYVFTNFLKQFRKALEHDSIGQMLNSRQVLSVLSFMGFVDEEPSSQDHELAKTITKMLSDSHLYLCVKRMNLFKFLTVLCDVTQSRESLQSSYFQEETSGLAMDVQQQQQPLIIIQFGQFDNFGRWSCSQIEREQIKSIFASMRSKRISRNQVQSRKKAPKQEVAKQTFQPKICPRSSAIAQSKFKKTKTDKYRVQNRLILSRNTFKSKIQEQLNKSIQKQLQKCTFKPQINSRTLSKQNIPSRSNSQDHLRTLLGKGNAYKKKQQKLRQLKIKINQAVQLEGCTFKPQTTKHSQSSKWVYVRNRDKQIQRLREGRKQRQYINQMKQRGYPTGVNWSQFINSKISQQPKTPILCIDLKILNQQYNINVFDGQNVVSIAERISREHSVPEGMWWKVQQLVRKAIQQCSDIRIQNNKIYACS